MMASTVKNGIACLRKKSASAAMPDFAVLYCFVKMALTSSPQSLISYLCLSAKQTVTPSGFSGSRDLC